MADLRHELLETRSDSAIPAVATVEEVLAVIGDVQQTLQPISCSPYTEGFAVSPECDEVMLSDSDESP
jgi:hypothetical protein